MGHVFDFLSVALITTELLDEQGRGARLDSDLSSSVLALELDHDADTLPLSSLLNDVLTDFFGVLSYYGCTRPRGPSLGARVAAGPGSPPKTLILTA